MWVRGLRHLLVRSRQRSADLSGGFRPAGSESDIRGREPPARSPCLVLRSGRWVRERAVPPKKVSRPRRSGWGSAPSMWEIRWSRSACSVATPNWRTTASISLRSGQEVYERLLGCRHEGSAEVDGLDAQIEAIQIAFNEDDLPARGQRYRAVLLGDRDNAVRDGPRHGMVDARSGEPHKGDVAGAVNCGGDPGRSGFCGRGPVCASVVGDGDGVAIGESLDDSSLDPSGHHTHISVRFA